MERLTKKCDVITRTTASVGETEYVVKENKFGKAINKLGELEDIMEKYNIEYPNVLDFYLQTISNLNTQNADLEQELAELKQKVIVPKFSLRQTCFIIWENDIMSAQTEKIIMKLSKDEEENSIFYSITNQYGYALRFPEEQIFATKEEAEQKLAEIKGKE